MDYTRRAVRALLGATAHPGGTPLTSHLLDRLALPRAALVGDVACGQGATLRLLAARGLLASGVDIEPAAVRRAVAGGSSAVVADAHALPWRANLLDAVLCECALSTFQRPATALAEAVRVLRPGAVFAMSDIVLRRDLAAVPVTSTLDRLTTARDLPGYRRLLEQAGLHVVRTEDRAGDARALTRRLARRLALVGARHSAAQARACADAVDAGALSYALLVAVRT